MSHFAKKYTFRVFDLFKHKPACSASWSQSSKHKLKYIFVYFKNCGYLNENNFCVERTSPTEFANMSKTIFVNAPSFENVELPILVRRTLDRKVAGLILTRDAVLYP